MIKGVATVTPVVQDIQASFAYERAKREMGQKLWQILYPETEVDPFDSSDE